MDCELEDELSLGGCGDGVECKEDCLDEGAEDGGGTVKVGKTH